MLFRRAVLERIMAGEITCAFRVWRRPTVRPGGTLRTALGVLAIDSVDRIGRSDLGEADARAAGYASLAELLDRISDTPGKDLYRIVFRPAGSDPRIALRRTPIDSGDAHAMVRARLDRFDRASRHGAWTDETLRLIADNPGRRAADLAATLNRETRHFKTNVRKLNALGLTESLTVGYRLTPRGGSFLGWQNRRLPDQGS